MRPYFRVLFTVGLRAKADHCCVSQYSSTQHIITNVTHLLKLRNI